MFKTIISEEMFERPQEVIDLLKPYCYYYSSENMDELMKCLQYVTKQQKNEKEYQPCPHETFTLHVRW